MKSDNAVGFGLVFALATALAAACGAAPKAEGTEGGPCYGNGSCNAGLACLSHLCVDASGYVVPGTGDASPDLTGPVLTPDAAATPDAATDAISADATAEAGPPASALITGACGISAPSQGCSDCLNGPCCEAGMVCISVAECAMCMTGLVSGDVCTKNQIFSAYELCAADNCSILCGGGG